MLNIVIKKVLCDLFKCILSLSLRSESEIYHTKCTLKEEVISLKVDFNVGPKKVESESEKPGRK